MQMLEGSFGKGSARINRFSNVHPALEISSNGQWGSIHVEFDAIEDIVVIDTSKPNALANAGIGGVAGFLLGGEEGGIFGWLLGMAMTPNQKSKILVLIRLSYGRKIYISAELDEYAELQELYRRYRTHHYSPDISEIDQQEHYDRKIENKGESENERKPTSWLDKLAKRVEKRRKRKIESKRESENEGKEKSRKDTASERKPGTWHDKLAKRVEKRRLEKSQKNPRAGWLKENFWRQATAADVRRCLAAGAKADARTRNGLTPLHMAAAQGKAETVRALLDAGAEVGARTKNGFTPLHMAAEEGHINKVRALLDAGAEVDAQTRSGETPLHRAALSGRTKKIQALLDTGAEVDARTENGETPLYLAALSDHTEAMRALLDAGAEVNARHPDGGTLLHWAASRGTAKTVRTLLAAGAKANARNERGNTPFDLLPSTLKGTDVYRRLRDARVE